MVENQAGTNNLLDTTDCLEAIGVFKGWKNFLFVIVVVCLLLLQTSFLLVDAGYIKIVDQAGIKEPPVAGVVPGDKKPDISEPAKDVVAEPNKPVEPSKPIEPNKPVEPNQPAEPNKAAEPNKPAEPNLVSRTSYLVPRTTSDERQAATVQRAIAFSPADFLFGITFGQLTWLIHFVNAVLILTASLYCLTLLFSLKVSMLGRLGGINHISRAFFLSLLMLVLLLPWQKVFGCVVIGAIYTPGELVEWYSAETEGIFDIILYYLRFSGYWLLIMLLLILSQLRSFRWAKAILRRLEIM